VLRREPVVYREEVRGMLFAIHDINRNLSRVLRLLEDEYGEEEEEDPEDD
jgi:hypothetical protein